MLGEEVGRRKDAKKNKQKKEPRLGKKGNMLAWVTHILNIRKK